MKKITKAVIPAAGFGTRFLPQTKAIPKEMMPIIDKPVIQYIVEELVEQGIETIIIVTGFYKRAIEDHFDNVFELEQKLHEAGKHAELEKVRKIADLAEFIYIRQKGLTGNATPILNAKSVIGDDPFIWAWGDELLEANPPRIKQLLDAYETFGATIVGGIMTSDDAAFKKYGYASGKQIDPNSYRLDKIIEKPGKELAPSNLAMMGGGIYTSDIFAALEESAHLVPPGEEFVYTYGVQKLLEKGIPVYARVISDATHYDCGNKLEYLKTVVEFALKREDLGQDFKSYLKRYLNTL